jgi:hypothetical protein
VLTDSALVRLTAFDGASNSTVDLSDALFAISRPSARARRRARVRAARAEPEPGPRRDDAALPPAAGGRATLEIYSPNGQRVWTSGAATYPAGEHSLRWSGRDAPAPRRARDSTSCG